MHSQASICRRRCTSNCRFSSATFWDRAAFAFCRLWPNDERAPSALPFNTTLSRLRCPQAAPEQFPTTVVRVLQTNSPVSDFRQLAYYEVAALLTTQALVDAEMVEKRHFEWPPNKPSTRMRRGQLAPKRGGILVYPI